ncbi:MAG: L,D-transpeptidase family protein [Candidatus Promineifilaceae bacterium]
MQQARTAMREGRLVDARRVLRQVIHEDPTNHAAWLLLAQATPDEKLAAAYVERARILQPQSPLVQRAGDQLASGKRISSPRRQFNWRLALPLIGLALILGLLASKAGQGALQQLFALQDEDAKVVLAAADTAQPESRSATQGTANTDTGAISDAGAESGSEAKTASQQANADTETGAVNGDKAVAFQPVMIAGSDKALPEAIVKGIESSATAIADEVARGERSATSSGEEDIAADETITVPNSEYSVEDESFVKRSDESENIDEIESGEAADTADSDQDVVVEEIESEAAKSAESDEGVAAEAESETAVEEELASNDSAVPASNERWIDVNLTTQLLTAYEGETPVLYSAISSGLWQFPTVTGEFHTWIKYESQDMTGYHLGYNYDLKDVPYVMYFFEDYAIHGAYWHNNFGTPMSHGCVNMNVPDAEWLYNWAPLGTLVSVHN